MLQATSKFQQEESTINLSLESSGRMNNNAVLYIGYLIVSKCIGDPTVFFRISYGIFWLGYANKVTDFMGDVIYQLAMNSAKFSWHEPSLYYFIATRGYWKAVVVYWYGQNAVGTRRSAVFAASEVPYASRSSLSTCPDLRSGVIKTVSAGM